MNLTLQRVQIRSFLEQDGPALQEILGDPVAMEYMEPAYSPEKTEAFLRSFCIARRGALACVHRESGLLLGYLLFNPVEDGVCEIGWVFRRDHWRQGYAYEACSGLLDYAFSHLRIHKVFAETIDPVKATGLMEKLGMHREGVQRGHTRDSKGCWADLYLYGLLREDWLEQHHRSPCNLF